MKRSKKVLLSLIQAGLWKKEIRLAEYESVDFKSIMQLAEEQAVIGLTTAGLNFVIDVEISQDVRLDYIDEVLYLERVNICMNDTSAMLIDLLKKNGIFALLVKGQGIAQCYENPLWRSAGDIDLLLDEQSYIKAKALFFPMAERIDEEDLGILHQPLSINGIVVELHGKMQFTLSKKVQKVIDCVTNDALKDGGVRVWRYNETDLFLPNCDNDVIIVFTHFLHHFFIEGVGLKQICDWCRLLWMYRIEIDSSLLEKRLHQMGLISEWRVFCSLVVNYLGFPKDFMPLYSEKWIYKQKAKIVLERIFQSGNLGMNNNIEYRSRFKPIIVNLITFFRRLSQFLSIAVIFPFDSPLFFVGYIKNRIAKQ